MAALALLVIGIAAFVFGLLMPETDKRLGYKVQLVGYLLWALAFVVWLKR